MAGCHQRRKRKRKHQFKKISCGQLQSKFKRKRLRAKSLARALHLSLPLLLTGGNRDKADALKKLKCAYLPVLALALNVCAPVLLCARVSICVASVSQPLGPLI